MTHMTDRLSGFQWTTLHTDYENLCKSFSERLRPTPLLKPMVRAGELGRGMPS